MAPGSAGGAVQRSRGRLVAVELAALLLALLLTSRTGGAPAPAPFGADSSVFPSPASPSPGDFDAVIKRTSRSCKGVCGSYANNFKCYCDRNCELNGDCCDDYEAECACSCPVGEYRADGTCRLITRDNTPNADYADLCSPCTTPVDAGSYYSTSGGLADACEVSPCQACPVGEFRVGCGGGTSIGWCDACPAPPMGLFYVASDDVFNCTLEACAAHHCAAGTYLGDCGFAGFSCMECPVPPAVSGNTTASSSASPSSSSTLPPFYFATGATDASVQSSSYAGTAAGAVLLGSVATTTAALGSASGTAVPAPAPAAVLFNVTCEYHLCADAEVERCHVGQYLSGCGPQVLNLTNSTTGEVLATTTTSPACFGDLSVDGVCYTYVAAKASLADAELHCALLGGHVAFSNDDRVLAALSARAGRTATWWLGAVADRNCTWRLLDTASETRLLDGPGEANWNPESRRRLGSEPNNCTMCDGTLQGAGECCLEVYGQRELHGLWNDVACAATNQYFCAVPMHSAGVCRNCTLGAAAAAAAAAVAAAATTATAAGGGGGSGARPRFAHRYTSRGNLSDTCQFDVFEVVDTSAAPATTTTTTTTTTTAAPTTVAPASPTTASPNANTSTTAAVAVADFVVDWNNASTFEKGIVAFLGSAVYFVLPQGAALGTAACADQNPTYCPGWAKFCDDPRQAAWVLDACPETCGRCTVDNVRLADNEAAYRKCATASTTALADALPFMLDTRDLGVGTHYVMDTAGSSGCPMPKFVLRVRLCPDGDSDGLCDGQDGDGGDDPCPGDPHNDDDGDGVCFAVDSCPEDTENDADGDLVCGDSDSCPRDSSNDGDGDGVCDADDSCVGDAANDEDADGVCDGVDSCLDDAANLDADGDGVCDSVDSCLGDEANDMDGDGVCAGIDSCPGDAANDVDADGVCDGEDSCLLDAQNDWSDSDGVCDGVDSCPGDATNDGDSDGVCDAVDSCSGDWTNTDADGDGVCDGQDSCPGDAENDPDGDGLCEREDSCRGDAANDPDSDGVCFSVDSCPGDAANDADSDGVCDGVDSCLADAANDADADGVCDGRDSCTGDAENDADADGVCDGADSCPGDAENDVDGDGVCGLSDSCPGDAGNDGNADDICDDVDSCRGDPANDADSDRVCDTSDSCPGDASNDGDGDGVCDAADSCVGDPLNDGDGDSVCDGVDSCQGDVLNDGDGDGVCDGADSCPGDTDNDADSDGVCDGEDSCAADPVNDDDSDGLCNFEDSCPHDGANDADSDGACTADDVCPADPLNDADSDAVCDGADSCPGTALNDVDGDGVCGDRACRDIQHYLELADCDVVLGDVDLVVPLHALADAASAVVAVALPRVVTGSVHLHYQWVAPALCGTAGAARCQEGSFLAHGSAVGGNLSVTGAATNVTVGWGAAVVGALAVDQVENVSALRVEVANTTAEQLRVATVLVDELACLRVIGVKASGHAGSGISVEGLRFGGGGDVVVTDNHAASLTVHVTEPGGNTGRGSADSDAWPLVGAVRVLRNNITRRAGLASVELSGLRVRGNVSVGDLGRAPTLPACRNAYGDAVCDLHVRGQGLDCAELFCPTCAFAGRCDLLCGVCSPEEEATSPTSAVAVARLHVGGTLAVTGVEFHEAVAVRAHEVVAGRVVVASLLPPPAAVRAPSGGSSSNNNSASLLAVGPDVAVRQLLRLSAPGLAFQSVAVTDARAAAVAVVELDLRGTTVAGDLVVRNVTMDGGGGGGGGGGGRSEMVNE